MATLIFSTVGTALGGPIGGMLGSMIGANVDQQLFGGGIRKGPRLGDLTVQTSSYGTMIPRVYGTMRVAGTVVWSTDLTETSELVSDGKSAPGEIYSYSASFAVALSSRPAMSVRRIWADGKLVRGIEGDLKVEGEFRFLNGNEGQAVDPLIASAEGVGTTPAYRGLALAVFEDLQLASFGNRIPVLTFELVASGETLGDVLRDGSGGAVDCDDARTVAGFALYGSDVGAAVAPLVEAYALDLMDAGEAFRAPVAEIVAIAPEEMGAAAAGEESPGVRAQRRMLPAASVPNALAVTYYDASRDYQSGQARASLPGARVSLPGGQIGVRSLALPLVIAADEAKGMADALLAREWAMRERLTVSLGPDTFDLEPGDVLTVPGAAGAWVIERLTIERSVVVAECRPALAGAAARAADAGRVHPQADVVALPSRLVLLDLPEGAIAGVSGPCLQLAVASPSNTWRPVPLSIAVGGVTSAAQSAASEAVIGDVVGVLADGAAGVVDPGHTIEVVLANADKWLVSADAAALDAGANLAAIGGELVQFAGADPVGEGRFLLSGLRRGRRGSEAAMTGHGPSEAFVLIVPAALKLLAFQEAQVGMTVSVTAHGVGNASDPPQVSRVVTA